MTRSTVNVQQLVNYSSGFLLSVLPEVVSAYELVFQKAMAPCIGLTLQPWGQWFALCPPHSLMNLRRAVDL